MHDRRGVAAEHPLRPARRAEIMTRTPTLPFQKGVHAGLRRAVGSEFARRPGTRRCFLVLLVGGGARLAIGLTFKPIVDEFGWSRGELGIAVALYMVVSRSRRSSRVAWRTVSARARC